MDKLLAKLTEQQMTMREQSGDLTSPDDDIAYGHTGDFQSSSNSLPITPAAELFVGAGPTARPASATSNDTRAATEELLRLKLELAQAQNKISRLDQELAQTRLAKPDSGRASPVVSPDGELPTAPGFDQAHPRASGLGKPQLVRDNTWLVHEDCPSDTGDTMPAGGFNRSRGIWANGKSGFHAPFLPVPGPIGDGPPSLSWPGAGRAGCIDPVAGPYGAPAMESYRGDRLTPDHDLIMRPPTGRRGNRYDNRFGSPHSFGGGYSGYHTGQAPYDPMSSYSSGSATGPVSNSMGMNMYPQYQQPPPPPQQQQVGTPLSPHATEFTSAAGSAWKTDVSALMLPLQALALKMESVHDPDARLKTIATEGQTYLPTTEPLNYRRLLDRNVNCNWKYIVDKIVCNNDQQASIFLQQKLKVGTPEQKYEIVEAIVAQAYPLMVNRFGNFLVQRCFEHGTPEQVIKIAEAIRGNTLNLSMDPFGCHVVQKAFDSVPEDYKAIMVHELLRRIPETVIHRYACHVWQKLFELRWTESPPQIMKYVNEALRGMWHEVALGETGSLVVQNIFENCLEDDKVSSP